ncbi:MAG: SGNH/GDSL hydrolase family protein [Prevotellaceae bacterium]|jgi:hypothetical protein|nr:SGNH/GDSL hydrolase family protein [Prevotellaceae bacterium]
MKHLTLLIITSFLCVSAAFSQNVKWIEGRQLTIEGRAGTEQFHDYDRLPAYAREAARKEVWTLSENSAGLNIRFSTDSDTLHVRWVLRSVCKMPHMTDCAMNGIDLYAYDEENMRWRWAGIKLSWDGKNTGIMLQGITKKMRNYMLYLPLYTSVDSVFVGVNNDAQIQKFVRKNNKKPIVHYGTSIVQGASASRAGMCSTAQIGRAFDTEVINLGFSGNARMEEIIGKVMTQIDALCYIVDCNSNMTTEMIAERTVPFVKQLRETRKNVPIILVERTLAANAWLKAEIKQKINEGNMELKKSYQQLLSEGFENIYYVSEKDLTAESSEHTIDGDHYTDIGFTIYSQYMINFMIIRLLS